MKHDITLSSTLFIVKPIAAAVSFAFALCPSISAQTVDSSENLPTVIVTGDRADGYYLPKSSMATKTDTPIEQIPQTVIVLPKKMIEDQGATKLSDVTVNVSNVQHADQRDFSTLSSFKIRGFSAAVVVDGVANPGFFNNFEPVYNIEQVDVVKGPGGSLYGSSQSTGADSVGGMIGITTKAPEAIAKRQVGVRIGSYNDKATFVDFNQPVNETLSVRLVAQTQSADSETVRVTTKNSFVAPSIAFNIDHDRKLVVRLKHAENEWIEFSGLPSQSAARNGNMTAEGMPMSTFNTDSVNVQYSQRLNEMWKFDLVVAESNMKFDNRSTYFTVPTRLWQEMKTSVISPTLTAKFGLGSSKHTLLMGAEQVKSKDNGFILADFTRGFIYTSYQAPYTAWYEPSGIYAAPSDPYNKVSSTTNSVYAQDQIDLGRWHIQAGVRQTRISLEDYYAGGSFFGGTDPNGLTSGHNDKDGISKLLPRIGTAYDLTNNIALFAGYGEGMKAPVGGLYPTGTKRKAEESKQTEVGIKLKEWNQISATLAWYDLTRMNVPADNGLGTVYQVGEQNAKGVDLNLVWKANQNMTVLAGLSDQKAVTVANQYVPASVGKQLMNVPSQTARLAMRYDIRSGDLAGIGFGLGLRHHSQLAADSSNTNFTPSATVYDAQVSYRMKDTSLNLAVNNLLDKQYMIPGYSSSAGSPLFFPALRRTAMLTATFDF
jgi:iron complex outermembrane receptor protein